MTAFTGYNIFPGFTQIGVVNDAVKELAVNFNMAALNALQVLPDAKLKWTELFGVTPAVFRGKVPIDLTMLDGYEPYKGVRTFKQVDVAALQVDVIPFDRNLEWPVELMRAGPDLLQIFASLTNKTAALVSHARLMKSRLAATVLMQGTPTTGKALVYQGNAIPGAGLPLFSSAATTGAQFANPLFAAAETRLFDNYFPAAGTFSPVTFETTRTNMAKVPSATSSSSTMGLEVTHVIGPTFMAEPFRKVMLQDLFLATTTTPGNLGAAVSNIYVNGTTPCQYWVSSELDSDPYVLDNPGKHMWIAISQSIPGAHAVEMVAPSVEFMPEITMFGEQTEMAKSTRKIHMISDLLAGAAAGLPHVCARYEQT